MRYRFLLVWFLLGAGLIPLIGQDRVPRILDHRDRVRIKLLDQLNSPYRETNLSITPDGRTLYFMSGRGGQSWSRRAIYTSLKGKPEFDGDIWFSRRKGEQWAAPVCQPGAVNTGQGEDEPNVSPDGGRVAFQSWRTGWEGTGGPYYQSTRSGSRWGKAKGLGGGINQFFRRTVYATDGMALSPDGGLFLVAAGADYAGKMDIYLAKRQRDGFWTYPRPLPLNTKQDERSVFMAGDGRTIYFASEGYGGLGGLDIFKTTLNADGTIGEIINIGAPFNTAQDDYGFIVRADGSEAYFIRDGDIYMADLRAADQDMKPLATLLVTGQVKDTDGKPVPGQIQLTRQGRSAFLGQTLPNGAFALAAQKGDGPFVLQFRSKDGRSVKQEITLQTASGPEEQIINLEIGVAPEPVKVPEPMKPLDLRTDSSFIFYFAVDDDQLGIEYKPLLDSLGHIHALNDSLEFLIVGHTDSDGSSPYNLELSARRVRAVLRKLVRHGARPSRMHWTFEGEATPAADNTSSEGRALNRRVELRLKWESDSVVGEREKARNP